jgi:hypothetical protein
MLVIASAVCLLLTIPATISANDIYGLSGEGDRGSDGSQGQQASGDSGNENGNDDDSRRERERANNLLNESVHYRFFGRFDLMDGVAEGKFITFDVDESSGAVTDFALWNGVSRVLLFDSVQILGFEPVNIKAQGSVLLMHNETVQVIVHDNPTGMIRIISSKSINVSFLLAQGTGAHPSSIIDDSRFAAVSVVGKARMGTFVTDEGGFNIESTNHGTYVNITLDNDGMVFKAQPFLSNCRISEEAITTAISEGRVAGEISLLVREGLVGYDTMEYRGQFRIQLLSAEMNRIRIQVQDQESSGKVMVLNVDNRTLDTYTRQVSVHLDGSAVRSTANPLEVLYAQGSEDDQAVYCLIKGNGTNQILIYVPSFSVHELAVTSAGPMDVLLSTTGIAAILCAIASVGVASFLLAKRR